MGYKLNSGLGCMSLLSGAQPYPSPHSPATSASFCLNPSPRPPGPGLLVHCLPPPYHLVYPLVPSQVSPAPLLPKDSHKASSCLSSQFRSSLCLTHHKPTWPGLLMTVSQTLLRARSPTGCTSREEPHYHHAPPQGGSSRPQHPSVLEGLALLYRAGDKSRA